jgi:hypothetical protein
MGDISPVVDIGQARSRSSSRVSVSCAGEMAKEFGPFQWYIVLTSAGRTAIRNSLSS